MDANQKAQIQAHAQTIAALLDEETNPEQVKTLAGIEEAVRGHLLEPVSPEIGNFLLQQVAAQRAGGNVPLTAFSDA